MEDCTVISQANIKPENKKQPKKLKKERGEKKSIASLLEFWNY